MLASVDFTTIEVWTKDGLVTIYLLFVVELATRRVHFAGCTAHPDEPWMLQVSRNLSDAEDGFLRRKKYLLMDRDAKFSEAFRVTLQQAGIESVRLPPRSPNLTPHIERLMRSLKDECLHRMIFFGEKALQTPVVAFLSHSHKERNHQGVGNRLIGIWSISDRSCIFCPIPSTSKPTISSRRRRSTDQFLPIFREGVGWIV